MARTTPADEAIRDQGRSLIRMSPFKSFLEAPRDLKTFISPLCWIMMVLEAAATVALEKRRTMAERISRDS